MAVITSPPARRLRTERRDLRLAIGIGLVVVSVVLGAKLLSAAGDRVPVWTARQSLAAGTTLRAEDLVAVAVAGDVLAAYVPQSSDIAGKVLGRAVAAGEMLPAAALTEAEPDARRLVTVAVDPLHAPPGLSRGERVDVYVSPSDGASIGQDGVTVLPTLVLSAALVADPGSVDSAGTTSQIGVVLDVEAADADRAVAAARGGDVDLVRVGTGS